MTHYLIILCVTLALRREYFCCFSANRDQGFIERIVRNAATYVKIFHEIIDANMPKPSMNFRDEDLTSFDVIME